MTTNSSGLKLYRVKPHPDADWQVLVVHRTARDAKWLGYMEAPVREDDYVDYRVWLVRNVIPPDTDTKARVIDCCTQDVVWACDAWGHDNGDCARCENLPPEERE